MFRKTYVEINEDSIVYNFNKIQEVSGKKLIAVIKANGYSSDDVELSRLAINNGIDLLAVSSLDEAMHLRKNGIDAQMLILGPTDPNDLDVVKDNDLSIITVSMDYVRNNIDRLKDIKVHIKINTGMNRVGILCEEAKECLNLLQQAKADIKGIMTHYACADFDEAFTLKQYNSFKDIVEKLDYPFTYIHSQATDASFGLKDEVSNYCRCGLAMLGYSDKDNGLKPAVKLYSEVTAVKTVPAGEGVSYGQHYTSDGEGYILTVPIGYADGFLRNNTGKEVYVDGEYGTIVGSICMDQMMIHTNVYHPVGSKVELFGDHISIRERAISNGTITYELLTNIADRVWKVFISKGEVILQKNNRSR
ncbi:MAG: alanine racemase [Erysipelotrichaceae bacterium]|nr:alanine racemase [Erysipelotrichaceae bacterium]